MSQVRRQRGDAHPSAKTSPPRIHTQIHRRNKAGAVAPLTDEWDRTRPSPPQTLKRPPREMRKS